MSCQLRSVSNVESPVLGGAIRKHTAEGPAETASRSKGWITAPKKRRQFEPLCTGTKVGCLSAIVKVGDVIQHNDCGDRI